MNDKIMLAVPVADSYDDNMELDLYCDGKKGNYRYLGLYKDKEICAVGKVTKIVIFKNVNGKYETDVPVTDDEMARFLEFKRRVSENNPQDNVNEARIFHTHYKNVGKMGIMNSKKIFLHKLPSTNAEEIAYQLDGQTWQLVKGQDIIPEKKRNITI